MGGTPQTIVMNFVNALGQDMLEKTPDELLIADGHGRCLSPIGILISKANLAIVRRDDSTVRDGDTVNVTGEISENRVRPLNRWFTVHDAVFVPSGDPGENPPEQLLPFLREIGQRLMA